MKSLLRLSSLSRLTTSAAAVTLCALSLASPSRAADASAILDDFSDAAHSSTGTPRLLIDDQSLGSQSKATLAYADGKVTVRGELLPGRGVPAFISFVVLTTPDGRPRDASVYTGIELRVRVLAGAISVQAASTDVTNHDYHVKALAVRGDAFDVVRVPFADLKPAWSAPTPLNPRTLTSINLVAFAMAKGDFAFEVDEISFY